MSVNDITIYDLQAGINRAANDVCEAIADASKAFETSASAVAEAIVACSRPATDGSGAPVKGGRIMTFPVTVYLRSDHVVSIEAGYEVLVRDGIIKARSPQHGKVTAFAARDAMLATYNPGHQHLW